jgi:hypothetical protein
VSSREPDDEFREIKREIIESRGLIIKTNNITAALSADVKSHRAAAGRVRAAHLTVNSATAYVLFVVVIFGGIKLWLDASIREKRTEVRTLQRDRGAGPARARRRPAREGGAAQLDRRAQRFYDLVRDGRKQEVVEAWEQLRRERLSPAEMAMFQDVVDRFRTDLSVVGLRARPRARAHGPLRRGHEAYEEAVRIKEDAGHVPFGAHRPGRRPAAPRAAARGPGDPPDRGRRRRPRGRRRRALQDGPVPGRPAAVRRRAHHAAQPPAALPHGSVANDARTYLAELSTPGATPGRR